MINRKHLYTKCLQSGNITPIPISDMYSVTTIITERRTLHSSLFVEVNVSSQPKCHCQGYTPLSLWCPNLHTARSYLATPQQNYQWWTLGLKWDCHLLQSGLRTYSILLWLQHNSQVVQGGKSSRQRRRGLFAQKNNGISDHSQDIQ